MKNTKVSTVLGTVALHSMARMRIIIVLLMVVAFACISCPDGNDNGGNTAHVHQWGAWTTTATCETAGTKTRVCSLDATHTESETDPAFGHDWGPVTTIVATETINGIENGQVCQNDPAHTQGGTVTYATGTNGLAYEEVGNPTTSYRVREGTVTAGAVYIPAFHRPASSTSFADYLPVTQIGSDLDDGINVDFAFVGTNITAVTIPASVTIIGSGAFSNCTSLTAVTIPEGVTQICFMAFYGSGLTAVTIPESVIVIDTGAFMVCASLPAINVDANNPNYASVDGILYNKAKTEIITVPGGISGNITLATGVTTIGMGAFMGCAGITGITIPASVTDIGQSAFRGTAGLTGITVDAGNPNYASEDGIVYNKAKTAIEAIPGGISGSVTIASGVTEIGEYAFMASAKLTGVTIPDSVTSIGDSAFEFCPVLASVTIGTGVTSIGGYAFNACTSLTSVTFGSAGITFESSSFLGDFTAYTSGGAGTYTRSGTTITYVWTKS